MTIICLPEKSKLTLCYMNILITSVLLFIAMWTLQDSLWEMLEYSRQSYFWGSRMWCETLKIWGINECLLQSVQGSTTLFSALLKKCLEREKVVICRYTARKNTPPRFVALLPQVYMAERWYIMVFWEQTMCAFMHGIVHWFLCETSPLPIVSMSGLCGDMSQCRAMYLSSYIILLIYFAWWRWPLP